MDKLVNFRTGFSATVFMVGVVMLVPTHVKRALTLNKVLSVKEDLLNNAVFSDLLSICDQNGRIKLSKIQKNFEINNYFLPFFLEN